MSIARIGTLDIKLPNKPWYDFSDGKLLQEESALPTMLGDLISGNFKIRILIPDHLEPYTHDASRPTMSSEFYIGLFESLFETLRDIAFPNLKADGNRSKIRPVGEDKSAIEIFGDIMAPVDTYAPFEDFLNYRIKFGIIDFAGNISSIEFDDDGMLIETGLDSANLACFFVSKYSKALDSMFLTDFNCRRDFVNGECQPGSNTKHFKHS